MLSIDGRLLRYYSLEIKPDFDNVSVGVTSTGRVLAISSRGLWELMPNGETRKIRTISWNIDHMTIGPDDGIYVSRKARGRSIISKIGTDNAITDIVTVDSDRVSDLEFDSNGNLFIADAQHGDILKFRPGEAPRALAQGAYTPSIGGGPFYLAFDEVGRLYTSSSTNGLAQVSEDGKVTKLQFHVDGDLAFYETKLYALGIYTSTLFKLSVRDTALLSKEVIQEGTVPWYVTSWGDVVVGERNDFRGKQFWNYYLDSPGHVEPNIILNKLQPNQFVFGKDHVYLLFGNVLKRFTDTGDEEAQIKLPGRFLRDTRLYYSPSDDRLFYYEPDSNSVIRVSTKSTETYYKLPLKPERVTLAATPQGKVYAGIVSSEGARIVDITNPLEERIVWSSSKAIFWLHIGTDSGGGLYAALGPFFQQVYNVDPVNGKTTLLVPESVSRYDMGFVDPQGFTVTESGTVIVSAPGLLIKFARK
ncbi:MAG: hypothetical protein HYX79_05980 [Chloroflexi bacterium]|nr:hypothetical protein [Chloroflexota bacterium]